MGKFSISFGIIPKSAQKFIFVLIPNRSRDVILKLKFRPRGYVAYFKVQSRFDVKFWQYVT